MRSAAGFCGVRRGCSMYSEERLNDAIDSALESLDITPTMFNEAESHYNAMASFLSNNGMESDVSHTDL